MLPVIGGIVSLAGAGTAAIVAFLGIRAQNRQREDQKEAKVGEFVISEADVNLQYMQAALARADVERNQMESRHTKEMDLLRDQMKIMAEKAKLDHEACEERVRILTIKVEKLEARS